MQLYFFFFILSPATCYSLFTVVHSPSRLSNNEIKSQAKISNQHKKLAGRGFKCFLHVHTPNFLYMFKNLKNENKYREKVQIGAK